MRLRRYRPTIDSLDYRLLLSDAGPISVATSGLADSQVVSPTVQPDGDGGVVGIIGWYLPDSPTDDPDDPSSPTQGGAD